MFISRNVGPARRGTLHCAIKTDLPAKLAHSSSLAIPFFSHVNCSPSFVRKCRKSCLAQGSPSRRVTLQPVTRFSPCKRVFIFSFCCKRPFRVWCTYHLFLSCFQRWQQTKTEYSNCFGWKSTNYIPGKHLSTVN